MTKVHMTNAMEVHRVRIDHDGVTPIFPLRAVVLQLLAPQAIEEWPVPRPPGASISFAFHPDLARDLAQELLDAADALDRK